MNAVGAAAMNINRVPSPLGIVIGDYKFRLIGMSKPGAVSNQIVLVESVHMLDNSDRPVKFAIYRSISQIIWRLAIIDSEGILQKLSDYTCTTQIHPELQAFIESVFHNIPILDVDLLNIGSYNFSYYHELIKHEFKRNNKPRANNNYDDETINRVEKYFDADRLLNDSNFELLSSGIFSGHNLDDSVIDKIANKKVYGIKYYDNINEDIKKYFLKAPSGEYDSINVKNRLTIMAKYLHDKLNVKLGTECLEYYIDPSISVITVVNHEDNINQLATQSKLFQVHNFNLRTTGDKLIYNATQNQEPAELMFTDVKPNKRYMDIYRKAGKDFKVSMIKNEQDRIEVISSIALYDRSPAVLSVKLESRANKDDIYTLYYFDYKYRGIRYKIPINIIKEGTKINKFGLPEKYISLNSYAGKILDYLDQIELYEGTFYDIYHIVNEEGDRERTYAYVGDLYNKLWPLTEIASLAKVAIRPCKPTGPKTYKRKIMRKNSTKKNNHVNHPIGPASNSENERNINNRPARKKEKMHMLVI